jgi:hypothetical protein
MARKLRSKEYKSFAEDHTTISSPQVVRQTLYHFPGYVEEARIEIFMSTDLRPTTSLPTSLRKGSDMYGE